MRCKLGWVSVNTWSHDRAPASLDQQTVIRMNRDTLYSFLVADISSGATLTIPDYGGRYLSVMVVNRDHYINRVFHEAGEHELTTAEFDTPYVLVAVRILVDPADPEDIAAVNALQDGLEFSAGSAEPFSSPEYDETSLERHEAGAARAWPRAESLRPRLRHQGRRRSGEASDRHRGRMGRLAGTGSLLPERRSRLARRASISSPCATCRWMPSGRSRSTTPTATSSRTTATRTPSTASPPARTRTAR